MPIYEYKCLQCDVIIEKLRSIQSRDDPSDCFKCGAPLERILSMFNTFQESITCNSSASFDSHTEFREPQFTGINFINNVFKNLHVGIGVQNGMKINIQDCKFDNVSVPIKVIEK